MNKKDSAFMANTNVKTLQGPPRFMHLILWAALLFFIIAVIWAHYAILDEVTSGEGKVIPSSQIQVVQNLEGGIIREILVREGEIVKQGQVLMQIDDTRFSASYKEARKKMAALELQIARLQAEIDDKPFIINNELKQLQPDLVRAQMALLLARKEELQQLQEGYDLAERELKLTRPLVRKGAVSEVEVIRLQRTANELKGKIITYKNKAIDELSKVRAELSPLKETFEADKDRLKRTTVRSPVKGIIKQIKVNTLGGVVQPGMDLMEIVPLDDTLLIEAKIRPADIGFIRPQQDAMVKITAYDFSIYGGLEGKVERISADTITEEDNTGDDESYYLIRVRTTKNFLSNDKKPLYIIPGMQASVDILTGRKSVLDYILKPILKARQRALRER